MAVFKARPLSRIEIRNMAQRIRSLLGIGKTERVDVIELLEKVLPILYDDFSYEYVSDEELDVWARTTPDEKRIIIRESVYIGACNGNGRDRFTIMHEIAHFFLHGDVKVRLARGNESIRLYEDPEWQADAFAGEFLMGYDVVKNMNPYEIAEKCQVSLPAAKCQYKQYQKIKKTGL